MLFYDIVSGRYFLKEYDDLCWNLIKLEERMLKGEPLTYNDYCRTVGLTEVAFGEYPMSFLTGSSLLSFELYPSEDETCILIGFTNKDENDEES